MPEPLPWVYAQVHLPLIHGTLCSNYKLRTSALLSIALHAFRISLRKPLKNRRIAFISNPAAFSVNSLREECHFN